MRIQWYPGHMAKAKRLLTEQLSRVDLVIELSDARIPRASRNPDLLKVTKDKKRVLILTKADLADPNETSAWLNYFKNNGEDVISYDATPKMAKKAKLLIQEAASETVERALKRGIRKTVRAMVIGVPNVGKSTFINRMCGSSITLVGDRPGVTRANRWVKVNPYLELLDTPGMLWPRFDNQTAARRIAYIGTVKDIVLDYQMLTVYLIKDLLKVQPQKVSARFNLPENADTLNEEEILQAVCKGRGFLMSGGRYDYERACTVVLDEFRSGKVGRITLESIINKKEKEDIQSEQA